MRPGAERSAPDNDLDLLTDRFAEAEEYVTKTIENRKEQHKKWNHHWKDNTWLPITPPPEDDVGGPKWKAFPPEDLGYPTPPASIKSEPSPGKDNDNDVEMQDQDQAPVDTVEVIKADAPMRDSPEPEWLTSFIPGAFPLDPMDIDTYELPVRNPAPACRLRYGRGGRCHLEARKKRTRGFIQSGVISDSDSDEDDGPEYYAPSDHIIFEYRCALNSRARPEGAPPAAPAPGQAPPAPAQQQATAGSAG